MMKHNADYKWMVYVGHSNSYDFKKELYSPIVESSLTSKYNFKFPHENSKELFNSKEFLKKCDYMIAEITYPSLGLGIEIGWADIYGIEIIFLLKKGMKKPNSISAINGHVIEYENELDLTDKLNNYFRGRC